jgi:hypothetical protein
MVIFHKDKNMEYIANLFTLMVINLSDNFIEIFLKMGHIHQKMDQHILVSLI